MEQNKIFLEAILKINDFSPARKKEIASQLSLPENQQKDLMFMSAILVSTGTNKNGATFLGSELVKARDTIALKPLDIEHKEDVIIGHIVSSMYMDQQGDVLDDSAMYTELASAGDDYKTVSSKMDKMSMDVGIICVVYRDRFKDLADEIEAGEWKVSMECYYDNYDVKVGDLIIPRAQANNYKNPDPKVIRDLKLVVAGTALGTSKVSRVLRGVKFCGVGIVKNPANERSLILEAAAENIKHAEEREDLLEAASDSTEVLEGVTEVVQIESSGYFLIKNATEVVKDSYTTDYNEASAEAIRRASLDITSGKGENDYFVVAAKSKFIPRSNISLNSDSEVITYITNDIGNVKEINQFSGSKESAELVSRWGPNESTAGICVSFEKYVRERPNDSNKGRIIATHWCKLFNSPCPVLGADAHSKNCLRNKFSRMVRDENQHGDALTETPFNPRSTVPVEDIELLAGTDLPSPKTQDEALADKLTEGQQAPKSSVKTVKPKSDTFEQPSVVIMDSEFIPDKVADNLVKINKKTTVIKDPYRDFPIQVASLTKDERKELASSEFGLSSSRKYPINTKERLISTMQMFGSLLPSLKVSEQKELFNNIIVKSLTLKVKTDGFEKDYGSLSEVKSTYGIPRLELFPLESREQIISAMSRFRHIKVEISEAEKKQLFVNILRAAKSLKIDSSQFQEKFKDLLHN